MDQRRNSFTFCVATLSSTCQLKTLHSGDMYRTAAKRLLGVGFTTSRLLRLPKPRPTIITSALCTSSMGRHTESPTIGNQSVNPNQSDPTAASSSSSYTAREEGPRRDESRKPRAEFEEEQARVLAASLRHVVCVIFIFFPSKVSIFMCFLGGLCSRG